MRRVSQVLNERPHTAPYLYVKEQLAESYREKHVSFNHPTVPGEWSATRKLPSNNIWPLVSRNLLEKFPYRA